MAKDGGNGSDSTVERLSGDGFTVPRPADVPGSTPPPPRKSAAPPADRTSNRPSVVSAKGRSIPPVIPQVSGAGRVSSPPRPGGPPKPAKVPSPQDVAEPEKEMKPVSAVVVTPMRIIGVGVSAPVAAVGDHPTPAEVPAARRPMMTPVPESDEEAVPLRRVSTPPPEPGERPGPDGLQAAVPVPETPVQSVPPPPPRAQAASDPNLPPLGAPPPPPPSREPSARDRVSAVPPTELASTAEVEVEVAPDSEPQIESLDDTELTEVPQLDPRKQRRLPPPPPLRTSFSDAGQDEGKRRPWWEEFFQEDYEISTPALAPAQLGKELAFITGMLGAERGASILDLGCGSGHHAVGLAQQGYRVVGLDTSTAMLTRAGSRARAASQPVEFVLEDMRELEFDQQFDAVLCWNATFGYFEREKNQAVLRGVHQALKPGGHFLLDIPNRDFIIDHEPAQNWFEGDGCVCMDDMRLDYITSRLLVKRTIMLDDGRNKECHYSMRLYSLHELGRLLHEMGFRVIQVSGAVSTPGVFLGSTSPRMIVLVTKP